MLAKRIISIILSCLLVLPSCYKLITARAEEETPFYTFEDILPMSRREILSISTGYKKAYVDAESGYYRLNRDAPERHALTIYANAAPETLYNSASADDPLNFDFNISRFVSTLKLPSDPNTFMVEIHESNMYASSHYVRVNIYMDDDDTYEGYSAKELYCAMCAVIKNDPNLYGVRYGVPTKYTQEDKVRTRSDVDCDYEITMNDVSQALSIYAKIAGGLEYNDFDRSSGDVNDDGAVDLADVQAVLKVYSEAVSGIAPAP